MAGGADNLKSFDAYADENGQNMGQSEPNDVARPGELQRRMASDPGGEAETARLASGRTADGADEATEAEIPRETLECLGNASSSAPSGSADEAVDRATASLGSPD